MTSTFVMRSLSGMHRAVLALSRGRLGRELLGHTCLELLTVGRRSGQTRSSMLTSPLRIGRSLVIVASRGGDDVDPAWFLNLRDQPRVRVAVAGGPVAAMVARVATPDERDRLWPRVIAEMPRYAMYQERTSRVIPVVLLEPPEGPAAQL
jgi:deazaflavin-dependent oxidoreductase (nitroreductase family)